MIMSPGGSEDPCMTDKSVLIIEDETDLAETIRFNLQREGYRARCAADGRLGLALRLRHSLRDLLRLALPAEQS